MIPVTVVIPTSPIPSHPSTAMIDAVIASIRHEIGHVTIIVTADGNQDTEYLKYLCNLFESRWLEREVEVINFGQPVHQSGMLETALNKVSTPLIYYCEHDWELLPGVPWTQLSLLISTGEFNYIKLHAQPRISPYHEHLMQERVIYQAGKVSDRYTDRLPGPAIPIIKTRQWSQNPHLASTAFYREKILPMCANKCDFIENIVHGVVANSPWEEYRCGIYNPAEGDMMRVRHLDGKNTR